MKILIGCALAVLVSFVSGSSLGQNNPQVRMILLETELTEPIGFSRNQNLPSAQLTIKSFNDPCCENAEFEVKGLPSLSGDEVYGLYVTRASSAANYISGDPTNLRMLFNVNFNGTIHLFLGNPKVFDSNTINAFVIAEKDDGREFDPIIDLATIILEGTSTLP